MNKTIRDRSIFTVIACIALAVSLMVPASVIQVKMAPVMEETIGAERTEAFHALMEEMQVWYDSKTVTEEGVVLTAAEDYEASMSMFDKGMAYLTRDDVSWDALSEELLVAYDTADLELAYLMVGVVIPLPTILSMQESFVCDLETWQGIGEGIDIMIAAYQSAYYLEA